MPESLTGLVNGDEVRNLGRLDTICQSSWTQRGFGLLCQLGLTRFTEHAACFVSIMANHV